MRATADEGGIVITDQPDFELDHIFDCGQCFRFNRLSDGSYLGTAFGRTLRISKQNNEIRLHGVSEKEFCDIWLDYLDLRRDYGALKEELCRSGDPVMREAVGYGAGIRILNQELWETMISFIISASNNIPRIKRIIELLSEHFGEPHTYMGQTYYSFPAPERLAALSLEELGVIRSGFRAKYILGCAKDVVSGRIDLDALKRLPTADAKRTLMSIYGVGSKVSDCILLFGMRRFDSFPVDVWIKRVIEYCYFCGETRSIKAIADFAAERFGDLGGIAQQYLFYYARSLRIGVKEVNDGNSE